MKVFQDAIKATYIYRNGYVDTLDKKRKDGLIGKNCLSRIKFILISTAKEFVNLFSINVPIDVKGSILCVINSKNNYESLKFLQSPRVKFVKYTALGKKLNEGEYWVFQSKFFFSLLFLLLLPVIILDKKNRTTLILLHKAFGMSYLFKSTLKNNKPAKLIFSNDHTPELRSFIIAAQEIGIHTVYIQHGSVSSYFPPLIFNEALLESQYSLDIYNRIGKSSNTQIHLIGMPKLDEAIRLIRERKSIETIGIAINQNDDTEIVRQIISDLNKDYHILLRKHPADIRNFNFEDSNGIESGNGMNVFEFINKIDFLIASDSSIHVESNSLKCRSLYFMMHGNPKKYDYYGFVKNCFVDEVKTTEQLQEYLHRFEYNNFDFYSDKIRYYNSSLSQMNYGKSSKLAKKYIYEGVSNKF